MKKNPGMNFKQPNISNGFHPENHCYKLLKISSRFPCRFEPVTYGVVYMPLMEMYSLQQIAL